MPSDGLNPYESPREPGAGSGSSRARLRGAARFGAALASLFAWAWLFISPRILEAQGHHDAAAWVGLWLIPMAGIVSLVGAVCLVWPRAFLLPLLAIAVILHVVVGRGSFPR